MKKMLFGTLLWMFTLAGTAILPNYVSATDETPTPASGRNNPTWTNMINGDTQKGARLLTTIQNTIKWILWFLATIAVVICLYWGFLMMTAAGDEKKYQNGITVLKYAAIWLAIIALSWIIVSAVFWFVNLNAQSGTMWDGATDYTK